MLFSWNIWIIILGCLADTAASDRRTQSPAKQRRMPALWRTVQQLRKGSSNSAGEGTSSSLFLWLSCQ